MKGHLKLNFYVCYVYFVNFHFQPSKGKSALLLLSLHQAQAIFVNLQPSKGKSELLLLLSLYYEE